MIDKSLKFLFFLSVEVEKYSGVKMISLSIFLLGFVPAWIWNLVREISRAEGICIVWLVLFQPSDNSR